MDIFLKTQPKSKMVGADFTGRGFAPAPRAILPMDLAHAPRGHILTQVYWLKAFIYLPQDRT